MLRVLLTGINGFVGHHVANLLNEKGIGVIGAGNQSSLDHNLKNFVEKYIVCDLTNSEDVKKIDLSNISSIINLAGFAKVGESKGQGDLYNKVNVEVHTVLYEECLNQGVSPRIIAVSTGGVYDPIQELPLTESSKLIDDSQTNEYVISKKKMEHSINYYRKQGLSIIIARPFNHSGPGQLPGFLLPDIGMQIEEAIRENKPLLVGNLDTRRDFTDVRDVARAYVSLATLPEEQLHYDLYNICSGKSVSGKEILQYLLEAYGVINLETQVDPSRLRKNDVMDIFGSNKRIQSDIGWEPKINIEKMVKDFVSWQKER